MPLPPGPGDHGYLHALERVVEPALEAFRPQLLLVAAGQDAAATDPLGRMSLTVQGFRALCDRAVALADAVCDGVDVPLGLRPEEAAAVQAAAFAHGTVAR